MIRTPIRLALAVIATLAAGQALAWASAGRFGGSTSHSFGSTSHENRFGGSSTHTAGQGTEHTNTYGGSTAHSAYGGTEHTNVYGGSTSGAYGAGATHTTYYGATAYRPPGYGAYPVYHPPTYVPYYSTGCYGCAAAAGAVVGMAVGAAVGVGQHRGSHLERLLGWRRRGQRQHRRGLFVGLRRRHGRGHRAAARRDRDHGDHHDHELCDGRQLCRAAGRVDGGDKNGTHLLPERQHLVPADVRRQRRALPGGRGTVSVARCAWRLRGLLRAAGAPAR